MRRQRLVEETGRAPVDAAGLVLIRAAQKVEGQVPEKVEGQVESRQDYIVGGIIDHIYGWPIVSQKLFRPRSNLDHGGKLNTSIRTLKTTVQSSLD